MWQCNKRTTKVTHANKPHVQNGKQRSKIQKE